MTDFLDIPRLRADDEAEFKKQAAEYFAQYPEAQSIVYAVAQYFADEAPDAVHSLGVSYPSRDPWWPHRCEWEAPPADGSRCQVCLDGERLYFGSLDSNEDAVYAWSAFCSEYGGGEGEGHLHDPVLIARRGADGGVELERIGHLVRPWLDFPNAFADREDAYEPPPPGKPEPAPIPWTAEERAMVDQIYARPDDDAPRKVLIDHWLEQGDPRGEFGATSFAAKVPQDKANRAWLGPLTASVGYAGVDFGRGPFARRVVVSSRDEQPPAHPEWATVESLRFATDSVQRFVPTMTGLREVRGVNAAGLRALADSGLTQIHTLGVFVSEDPRDRLIDALKGCFGMKGVKTLILEGVPTDAVIGPLVEPFAAQLERVEVWLIEEEGWEGGGGGAQMLSQLVALRPGLDVAVGHEAISGAQRGLVASARSGERTVQLDHRGLPHPGDLAAAKKQLGGFELGPLSPHVMAVPDTAAPAPREEPVPAAAPPSLSPQAWVQREVTTVKETTSTGGWVLLGGVILFFVALGLARWLLL